jgi:integrase/recombinase XerD
MEQVSSASLKPSMYLAREVKTPRFSRNEVKTPAPPTEDVQKLIDSIDLSHIVGLRDRAILGILAYTFARIGAVVSLRVKDYFQVGKRSVLRFSEKGGKEKEIPVHHKLESILDRYRTTRPTGVFPLLSGSR